MFESCFIGLDEPSIRSLKTFSRRGNASHALTKEQREKQMLSCKDINENADAHIDGELSIKKRIEVAFHLLMCVHCRRFVQQLKGTVGVLRNQQKEECSEEQLEDILKSIEADASDK